MALLTLVRRVGSRAERRERALAATVPVRLAAAGLGGLVLLASFPPYDAWYAGPVAVAVLALAVRGLRARTAALAGLVYGLVFFVGLLSWLRVVGVDAWLLLALSQAAFWAALGAGLSVVLRLPVAPLWVACVWVAVEWARHRVPLGGFSFGSPAFGQVDGPLARYAAVGGAPLVTFAVALAGGLLAAMVVAGRRRPRALGAVAAGVLAVALLGLAVPVPTAGQRAGGPADLPVAVVQGNVPRLGLDPFAQARQVTRNHVQQTEALAARVAAGQAEQPALVVWPENSADVDPLVDPTSHDLVAQAVAAIGAPTLVGAVLDGPGPRHVRNASVVWSPRTGPGAVYVKQHLVPFGEYVPWRSVLGRWIGRFSFVPDDFVPGHRVGLLDTGPVPVADVICFEVAYDGVVRDAVRAGGRLLVVQTNDATFEHVGADGRGGESAQQLAIARLRAIEHGRAVLVAATSGVSAVVSPDGTVRARSGVFEPAVLEATVPLRDSLTPADRVGAVPEWVLAMLGIAAVLAGVGLRWRARRADSDDE